jgi:hypothetical protein
MKYLIGFAKENNTSYNGCFCLIKSIYTTYMTNSLFWRFFEINHSEYEAFYIKYKNSRKLIDTTPISSLHEQSFYPMSCFKDKYFELL